jgi:glycosyltransferase involved in cell wall biosynthesis
MRVLIDGHALGSGLGGNETYLRGLLMGLDQLAPLNASVFVLISPRVDPAALPDSIEPVVSSLRRGRRLLGGLRGVVSQIRADVLHVQQVAPVGAGTPISLYMADFAPWYCADSFRPCVKHQLRLAMRRSVRAAASVIVPNSDTIRQMNELGMGSGVAPTVVPLGSDGLVAWAVPLRSPLPPRMRPFVWVGNLQARKRLDVLLEAVQILRSQGVRTRVCVVGRVGSAYKVPGWGHSDDPNVRFLGRIGNDELAALLQTAVAYVATTEYEGFGLPAFEAAALGCPVIASDIAPYRELLAGQVQLYPVGDADALADRMKLALLGHVRRAAVARLPTWKDCAARTFSTWERLCARQGVGRFSK